ncbi:MAG: hypothetical protein HN411_05375 [Waddliaceae bacterium]|jgi:hypothetical protein|nr:hypothetical protein [Waddliaceae bacterium]MBT3579405.1 hypothetical protein [Waddliaceae bacterium]MBT4444625.1 hypothetical protein [Waddliaceae bacterium]MBT6928755.1 hypothetical protein [Waddliaceae bacterium]MBT7264223.1 hypothetical protein [Waddliaceae bacterium]
MIVAEKTQDIKTLTKRYEKFREAKIRAEEQGKAATHRSEELKTYADEKYGTHDIEELKKILKERSDANEKHKNDYQKHLDDIEKKLQDIEISYKEER